MKKRISLFLVMVMALTMVLGTGVCAWAVDPVIINEINITLPAYTEGMTANDIISGISMTSTQNAALIQGLGYYEGYDCVYEGETCLSQDTVLESGKTYIIFLWLGRIAPAEGPTYRFSFDTDRYNGSLKVDDRSGVVYNEVSAPMYNETDYPEIKITYRIGSSPSPSPSPSPCPSPKTIPVITSTPDRHTHNYEYQVIKAPSVNCDGEEAEVCTICGDVRSRQSISAMAYALYDYAIPKINSAKPGQTVTFEFGEWNSFPKSFMEKLVEKSANGVTFVFKYKWNHKLQTITIPAGTPIDLNFDYYGPAKMAELYGMY